MNNVSKFVVGLGLLASAGMANAAVTTVNYSATQSTSDVSYLFTPSNTSYSYSFTDTSTATSVWYLYLTNLSSPSDTSVLASNSSSASGVFSLIGNTAYMLTYSSIYGKGSGTLTFSNVAAVPEPETYALMGIGLLGLLAARRRKVAQAVVV